MNTIAQLLIGVLLLGSCKFGWSATVNESLHINADSLTLVTGENIPYLAFNSSNTFEQKNSRIEMDLNDSLSLWIYNNDTVAHGFSIKNLVVGPNSIPVGDSLHVGIRINQAGCYLFYDPVDFPNNAFCGLGGMIVVKNHNHTSFYWNLKTHQTGWNEQLLNNGSVVWSDYAPDYYTINSYSFPDIMADTDSRITGQTGDTLIVYMANTGQSTHSIHLHGYHATILYSSKNSNHNGRIKDTLPLYSLETLVLQLIPDKPGEYPIHDHNLVAVSGNGLYPNGMLSTILISP